MKIKNPFLLIISIGVLIFLLSASYYLVVYLPQKEKQEAAFKIESQDRLRDSQNIRMYEQAADECEKDRAIRLPELKKGLQAANELVQAGSATDEIMKSKLTIEQNIELLTNVNYIQACANYKLDQMGY